MSTSSHTTSPASIKGYVVTFGAFLDRNYVSGKTTVRAYTKRGAMELGRRRIISHLQNEANWRNLEFDASDVSLECERDDSATDYGRVTLEESK